MTRWRWLSSLLLVPALISVAVAADEGIPEGFDSLFNGKDLTGWKLHSGKIDSWGTEEGVLFASGDPKGWLFTEKEYADFELRLEYKISQNGNSGVAIRAPGREEAPGNVDPTFKGMEIQILDDDSPANRNLPNDQCTGAIFRVVGPANRATRPAGQWNRMHIIARGRQITVTINGTQVLSANLDDHEDKVGKHPGLHRSQGFIGLQSWAGQIEFRNLYIKSL